MDLNKEKEIQEVEPKQLDPELGVSLDINPNIEELFKSKKSSEVINRKKSGSSTLKKVEEEYHYDPGENSNEFEETTFMFSALIEEIDKELNNGDN
jgi:thymidylate kinase